MKDFSNEIRAYALKNAVEFGKADAGRILPKLFQHGLDKKDIKNIMPEIEKIAKQINKLKPGEREKELENYKKYAKEREEKEKDLPEIDVSGLKEVVTRLAPEPSKYNHLGHALTFILNYIYAEKNNGKCLLRFEDTNPEKVSQEYVDNMKEDIIEYLGIKPDEIRFVSDDMEILYSYAEKLINLNKAYICFCDREKMQDLRHNGKECECRSKKIKDNLKEWKNLLEGKYKEGEAVLRIKGDMKSNNHVMRDSVLFRIMKAQHYRQGHKYHVWPMYDFYNPIEDSLMGVTLILRSNEFDMRVELQDYLKDLLQLNKQKIIQYGRFNVMEFTTKGRELREMIESGEYMGWDDPRLITLKALKRRGIVKESFYELVKQIGLSKHPINLDFDAIAAINRKIIDEKAARYSFVENPVEIKIDNKPPIKSIELPRHPDKPEDTRELKIGKSIFISKEDYEKYKGNEVRLLHLYNIDLSNKKSKFTSIQNKNIQKINWVGNHVKVKVLMPNALWKSGFADEGIEELSVDDLIQFERYGFCRLDNIKKVGKELTYEFWFAHK
ncbi:MAG: glutamate--tRNA ligase [Nanoarchaeota archaeon]|nr:glutamate--tRNA ligase [Nanoarchaeota archaeon]